MSLLRMAIGTVLRRLRLRQGRTLKDVADAAGVSLPYLSEVERGRKEASSEVLAGICRALGLALPDLLEQVRLELLRSEPAVLRLRSTLGRAGGSDGSGGQVCSASGRSALGRHPGRIGIRTRRLSPCRTLTVFSSSTSF